MSVRFFVTSSALLIFCWLAVAFLLVVPMETYPGGPGTAEVDEQGREVPVLAITGR